MEESLSQLLGHFFVPTPYIELWNTYIVSPYRWGHNMNMPFEQGPQYSKLIYFFLDESCLHSLIFDFIDDLWCKIIGFM